jgi:hypothetical protein
MTLTKKIINFKIKGTRSSYYYFELHVGKKPLESAGYWHFQGTSFYVSKSALNKAISLFGHFLLR